MFQKIKPRRISDEIYEQIKELILTGQMQPGQKLPPERELAAQMGVSRPSLREAIHRLLAQGYIEQVQGGGTYIRSITETAFDTAVEEFIKRDESVPDLMEMRMLLETWSAAMAARRATDDEIVQLEEYLEEMRMARDELEGGHLPDANFHSTITYATHNVLFTHLMNNMFIWIERVSYAVRSRMYKDPDSHTILFDQHKMIYEAIRDRAPERAYAAMMAHMEFVEQQTQKIFTYTRD